MRMRPIAILFLLLCPSLSWAQQIANLSPDFSPPTVSPYTLTVNGSGFTSGAVVEWQGMALATTVVSAFQLTATVPCCLSNGVSTVYITVVLLSGSTSLPAVFRNFGPSAPITSYSPTSFTASVGFSLQVHGNYFVTGSQIYFDNHLETTTFVSQTLVTANVPGGDVDSRHQHSVRVQYPVIGSTVGFTPTALNFGSVAGGMSSTLPVTMTNLSTSPLTITSIVLTGSGTFSQTNTCSSPLPASSSCTISVTFAPLTTSSFSGQITITDSGVGSPHIVTLSGSSSGAAGPIASFSPTSWAFPNTSTGASSSPKTITLTNTGGSSMTISSVALGGAGAASYSRVDTCVAASPLAAAASCTVAVTFTPTAAGLFNASLNFTDTAPGSPQSVTLSGTGVTNHFVNLTWTGSVSSGITGYNVYRGTVSGGPYSLLANLGVVVAYTDAFVTSGTHYCYVVTTVAPGDTPPESVNSTESCATIP